MTCQGSLEQLMATETYHDLERVVGDTAWKFFQRYGGDWDEIRQRANLYFMRAFRTYQRARSAPCTWVRTKVWYGLKHEYLREFVRHGHAVTFVQPTPDEEGEDVVDRRPDRHHLDLRRLYFEAGGEAANAVKIALELWGGLEAPPADARDQLVRKLRDGGKTWAQIAGVFRTLGEAFA